MGVAIQFATFSSFSSNRTLFLGSVEKKILIFEENKVKYETFLFQTQNEKEDKSLRGSRKPEKCFRNGLLKSGLPTNFIMGN